ncbi:hypothetical protein TorRG33x02_334260 [Trema orientale]|uniref:Uncharacterized protein n=1 Tax=Trema orientale TaxID=63057 RepID=A0A2P5B2Y0_TREOI|nr:hypothetical protein TorRG33x02_334260 [Trema orientale]
MAEKYEHRGARTQPRLSYMGGWCTQDRVPRTFAELERWLLMVARDISASSARACEKHAHH